MSCHFPNTKSNNNKIHENLHTSSTSYHQDQLHKHCRICGGRLNKAKGKAQPVYSCTGHSLDLQDFVGAPSNSTKEEGTFPSRFCNICYTRLRKVKKASKDGLPFHPIVAMEWSPHLDGCRVRDNKNNQQILL